MKQLLKNILFGCAWLTVSPFFLIYRIISVFTPVDEVFQGFSQFFALFPGRPGNYIRKAFYFLTLRRSSVDVVISFGTIFSTPNCDIGRHVYMGTNCMVGRCSIGDDVLIGSDVHIISKRTHGFDDLTRPVRLQSRNVQITHIGQDVWIGNGAIIMADIGDHCVIGAGSVVTKTIESFSVVAGNPARLIKERK